MFKKMLIAVVGMGLALTITACAVDGGPQERFPEVYSYEGIPVGELTREEAEISIKEALEAERVFLPVGAMLASDFATAEVELRSRDVERANSNSEKSMNSDLDRKVHWKVNRDKLWKCLNDWTKQISKDGKVFEKYRVTPDLVQEVEGWLTDGSLVNWRKYKVENEK